MHQSRDQGEDRTARYRKPELLANIIGIGALAVPVSGRERLRQLGAEARVPAFIDAVEDAGELLRLGADAKQSFHAATELGRRDLPGIGCADRGQMRGVDDTALEEGKLVVEFDTVD